MRKALDIGEVDKLGWVQHALHSLREGGGTLRAFRRTHFGAQDLDLEGQRVRSLDGKIIRKSSEKLHFWVSQTIKNRALERSWGRLWGILGCLGQSWWVLGASGVCYGCILERQRASWRRLGAILGRLERILEGFWGVLEAF